MYSILAFLMTSEVSAESAPHFISNHTDEEKNTKQMEAGTHDATRKKTNRKTDDKLLV
jgi:hypothetical protein